MGGSESKNLLEHTFLSVHPYFRDAKLITNKDNGIKVIEARFKVQN